jgi:uncharacterized repeat protein (TIGR03803 family)
MVKLNITDNMNQSIIKGRFSPPPAGRLKLLKIMALQILVLTLAWSASAQYYAILRSFGPGAVNPATGAYTNADGDDPVADLVISGQTVYGTALGGGTNGSGTIFKMNFDGSGFAVLHHFLRGTTNASDVFTNGDGQSPHGRLILNNDTLYGTTTYGGLYGGGTVFRVDTNGNHFTVLKQFQTTGSEGAYPYAGVLLPGPNVVIGETSLDGAGGGLGTVFQMDTNGNNVVVLHEFSSYATNGSEPFGALVQSGNTVYGTTYSGGTNGTGTVFRMNTNGANFALLKSFSALVVNTNGDGAYPRAGLILSGGVLYGTAYSGGVFSNGVAFRINTDGSGFTNIHSFSGTTVSFGGGYNVDGANPASRLTLVGNALYGTTPSGSDREGNIFSVNTDGGNFLPLRAFGATIPYDGIVSMAGLALSGAMFFGTTEFGGTNGTGTVFAYRWDNVPPVSIAQTGTNVILSWPTDTQSNANNFTFTLQSTPQLGPNPAWTNVTNAPGFNPFIGIGWNVLTNPATGPMKFFRLSPY